MADERIEEIVVTGTPIPSNVPITLFEGGGAGGGLRSTQPVELPDPERGGELAGLAAVAITEPIPEVIVTEKRPPKLRLIRGTRPWPGLARAGTLGFGGVASGVLAAGAAILGLDALRRAQEQEAWENADLRDKEAQDAELRRLARLMSVDINVYGQRPDSPYFYPFERFPFEQPQTLPRDLPEPEAFPDIETQPFIPEFPDAVPAPPPQIVPPPQRTPAGDPFTQPATRPSIDPGENPLLRPGRDPARDPFRQPRRDPQRDPRREPENEPLGVGSLGGLTGVGAITLPFEVTRPEPQAQPGRKKCPPCKKRKKKEEPRKKCWKKMVEERKYERWDKVYNWTEIDCNTGREL